MPACPEAPPKKKKIQRGWMKETKRNKKKRKRAFRRIFLLYFIHKGFGKNRVRF
jgi:hypothetical protein